MFPFMYFRRKERESAKKRYYWELLIGYGIPILIVLLTGIVEASAPQCSPWRPRFLDENCFFAGEPFQPL